MKSDLPLFDRPLLPPDLVGDARRVAEILVERRGAKQSATRFELVTITGLSDRIVRDIIARLIVDWRLPIGSAPKGGYYWITDPNELLRQAASLRAYIRQLSRRETALRRIAQKLGAGDLFERTKRKGNET